MLTIGSPTIKGDIMASNKNTSAKSVFFGPKDVQRIARQVAIAHPTKLNKPGNFMPLLSDKVREQMESLLSQNDRKAKISEFPVTIVAWIATEVLRHTNNTVRTLSEHMMKEIDLLALYPAVPV